MADKNTEKFLEELNNIRNFTFEVANTILPFFGYIVLPRYYPPYETLQQRTIGFKSLSAAFDVAHEDAKEIQEVILGLARASNVDLDKVSPETRAQIDKQSREIAETVVSWYPFLLRFAPNLINTINPYSRTALAMHLASTFAKSTKYATHDEINKAASKAAAKILNDPHLHMGFTSVELGDIAKSAVENGRITTIDPNEFTEQLSKIVKLYAPVRDLYLVRGEKVDIDKIGDFVAKYAAQYPTLSEDQLAHELRRELELGKEGGEFGWIAKLPGTNKFIREAGVDVKTLSKQHEILKIKAADSFLGSAAGAIIRGVKTGVLPYRGAIAAMYDDLMNGRPLKITHPFQVIELMARSGVNPNVASMLVFQKAENKYWLTPQAISSVRLTQFNADWSRRFYRAYMAFPGNDPVSQQLRMGLMSQMVQKAGYNNIHHFLALHMIGPQMYDVRTQAGELAKSAEYYTGEYATVYRNRFQALTSLLKSVGEGKDLDWAELFGLLLPSHVESPKGQSGKNQPPVVPDMSDQTRLDFGKLPAFSQKSLDFELASNIKPEIPKPTETDTFRIPEPPKPPEVTFA